MLYKWFKAGEKEQAEKQKNIAMREPSAQTDSRVGLTSGKFSVPPATPTKAIRASVEEYYTPPSTSYGHKVRKSGTWQVD